MRIDHVIYAAADLDTASAHLEDALGVPVLPGGRHEGLGTENRVVPLGGGWLEVLAVADAAEAERSGFGRVLLDRLAQRGDGLMGWAVAAEDVAGTAARLGTDVTPIAREGMTAHLTGLREALAEPWLPFFIQREPGADDPGARGDGPGITWLEVAGDAGRLQQWLDGAALPVRVVEGEPGVVAMGVGDRELRG